MRRLLTAAALGLLALPLAIPAATAHTDANVHALNWGEDWADPFQDGLEVWATEPIIATADFDDGMNRWRIEMTPEGSPEPVAVCDRTLSPPEERPTIRCNWDTRRAGNMTEVHNGEALPDAPMARNGRYVVTVKAWNVGRPGNILVSKLDPGEHVLQPSRTVTVSNPVSNPTGVNRSFNSANRSVVVTWDPNPEPDIEYYAIRERFNGGEWVEVDKRPGGSTTFNRQVSEVGTYQYQVAAKRTVVDQSGWVETPPLEVAAIPTVTPGTAGGPSGPEGEPGVFLPGSEDSTTTTTGRPRGGSAPRGNSAPPKVGSGLFAPGSIFSRPSVTSSGPATTTTVVDDGYQETLPYKLPQQAEPLPDGEVASAEEPQTFTKIVTVPRPKDPRALLVPLAGGLAVFILAMQITYLARRRPALVPVEDDFGDWVGL